MAVKATIDKRELEKLNLSLGRVKKRVATLDEVEKQFKDYTMNDRIPKMMKNQGRVMGRYGGGYKKWADNSPWVRRAKADRRVFYKHGRSKSSIEEAYKFSGTARNNTARASFRLVNQHEAAKYIQAGAKPRVVRAKPGKTLAIPFGFGITVFAKSARIPKVPARQLDGFRRGDEKKLIVISEQTILEPIK